MFLYDLRRASWLSRLMSIGILFSIKVASPVFAHPQVQWGYLTCIEMPHEADRQNCVNIVVTSTRIYPLKLVNLIKMIPNDNYKNHTLNALVDFKFEDVEDFSPCADFTSDAAFHDFIRCVKKLGKAEPRIKVIQSEEKKLSFENYNSWDMLVSDIKNAASQGCRGWQYFHIPEDSWKICQRKDNKDEPSRFQCKNFPYFCTRHEKDFSWVRDIEPDTLSWD